MITFEDIKKANDTIATTDIKGKDYAEVNQRIKAFRMVYPEGTINTEIISLENGVCTMKATAMNEGKILGTGFAQEKEGSTFINKTSYIENCETSAVGRALGMCGFGIDTSVCSAEELQNALNNQNKPETKSKPKIEYATEEQIAKLTKEYQGKREKLDKFLNENGVTAIMRLPKDIAQKKIDEIEAWRKKQEE
nr:MAG TPA: hypothetical protein [Caudoviricetes sp.]